MPAEGKISLSYARNAADSCDCCESVCACGKGSMRVQNEISKTQEVNNFRNKEIYNLGLTQYKRRAWEILNSVDCNTPGTWRKLPLVRNVHTSHASSTASMSTCTVHETHSLQAGMRYGKCDSWYQMPHDQRDTRRTCHHNSASLQHFEERNTTTNTNTFTHTHTSPQTRKHQGAQCNNKREINCCGDAEK